MPCPMIVVDPILPQRSPGIRIKEPAEIKDYDNRVRQNLIDDYNRFKETKQIPDWSPIRVMLFQELLCGCGLSKKAKANDAEKQKVLKTAISNFIGKGYVGDVRRLEKQGFDAPEVKEQSFVLAERRTLIEAFERMANDGIIIEDYIKLT